jgi:hypothetical protein
MRVDELVAIAELFSVSLDTLLSHSVEQADNEAFALRELADAARQTADREGAAMTEIRVRPGDDRCRVSQTFEADADPQSK